MAQPRHQVVPTGDEGERRRGPEHGLANERNREEAYTERLRRGVAGEQGAERAHLKARLPLGEPGHRQADAEAGKVLAEAGHQDLAQQHHDGRKESGAGEAFHPGQQHQRRAHQQLVGDGVEHPPEAGDAAPLAGDLAVEIIGDGGGREDDAGEDVAPGVPHRHERHEHRDRGDARQGQQVGKVGGHWLGGGGSGVPAPLDPISADRARVFCGRAISSPAPWPRRGLARSRAPRASAPALLPHRGGSARARAARRRGRCLERSPNPPATRCAPRARSRNG
jgi:hypothetical protein